MPPRRRPPKSGERNRHGAEGAVWKRIVSYVVSRDRGICWVCGHSGAQSADHVIPVTERPDLATAAVNLRAAHSWPGGCPDCTRAYTAKGGQKPVYCNEIKGGMSVERARRIISERTGLALGVTPEDKARGERDWLGLARRETDGFRKSIGRAFSQISSHQCAAFMIRSSPGPGPLPLAKLHPLPLA